MDKTITPDTSSPSTQNTSTRRNMHTQMRVLKRNGEYEPVDLNKILVAIDRCCHDLDNVDTMRVATRTISGLYDGATTQRLMISLFKQRPLSWQKSLSTHS